MMMLFHVNLVELSVGRFFRPALKTFTPVKERGIYIIKGKSLGNYAKYHKIQVLEITEHTVALHDLDEKDRKVLRYRKTRFYGEWDVIETLTEV